MPPRLPDLEVKNPHGSCWACVESGQADRCDTALPNCNECRVARRRCPGYQARAAWLPTVTTEERRSDNRKIARVAVTCTLSSSGLPATENKLLRHYFQTVSRISVAVDYTENGYRKLCILALEDPALLHALFAFSESHLSRIERRKDTRSRIYVRKSLEHLRRRLNSPTLAKTELTLATMIILFTYEVCTEEGKWKYHFDAISSWIRSRQAYTDIDPFLTTLIRTVAIHSTLCTPGVYRHRGFELLGIISFPPTGAQTLDVLQGCSVGLTQLMIDAARLHDEYQRTIERNDKVRQKELREEQYILQERIQASSLSAASSFHLSMSGCSGIDSSLNILNTADETQIYKAAQAAAECFRHALYIYVFRIHNNDFISTDSEPELQQAVDQFFHLLPLVPATEGPGIFLGWALVVIGAEVDSLEKRQYVQSRLRNLELLCLNQGIVGRKVLEAVWGRRDCIRIGTTVDRLWRWQDVMLIMREDMALI